MTEKKIAVDIWSDVACPWCYLGERSFYEALRRFEHADDVEVTFHSYQLNPSAPERYDGTHVEYLQREKGISAEQAHSMDGVISERGSALGLDYDFDAIQITNTRLAHELLHYAESVGEQLRVLERLFAAYFSEGRHVGTIDELVELGTEAGLDGDKVREALESHEFADAVDSDIAQAAAYGIQGVPFFVIDQKYGVSGAQEPETFDRVLDQVWNESVSVESGAE